MEVAFRELNQMLSTENVLTYTYWKIQFTVHTYPFDE